MNIFIEVLMLFSVLCLVCFSFYGMGSLFIATFGIIGKNYDELERKAIFDSLAYGMIFIVLLHLVQFCLGLMSTFSLIENYIPCISSGGTSLLLLDYGSIAHSESFFFDTSLISIIYIINKYRFGLWSKKRILIPIFIIFIIALLLFLYIVFIPPR